MLLQSPVAILFAHPLGSAFPDNQIIGSATKPRQISNSMPSLQSEFPRFLLSFSQNKGHVFKIVFDGIAQVPFF